MDAMECLMGRQSTPAGLLVEPAPTDDEVLRLLETAMRAPDHDQAKKVPKKLWR